MFMPLRTYKLNTNGNYPHNGVDRIDNNKGYEFNNCVPCCGDCNIAKHKLSLNEFISHARKIANHTASIEIL